MPSRPNSKRSNTRRSNRLTVSGVLVILFLIIVIFISRVLPDSRPQPPPASGGTPAGAAATRAPLDQLETNAAAGAIAVFFSDPLSDQTAGGPDEALTAAIDAAQRSVDMAIYNLSLENVTAALIAAHQRGVAVRLVLDFQSFDRRQPDRLRAAGIPITAGPADSTMHNKFTVIDGAEVWTGSMNYTSSGAYDDFNNILRLRSQRAAQNYTVEFEEMFSEGLFGRAVKPATPHPTLSIDGAPVEIYFSPDDGAAAQIIGALSQASHSIDILAYSFTSDDIAETIHQRAAAGVTVRGVFDESQVSSNTGGEFEAFQASGYAVRLDGIPGQMHHKTILIDNQVIISGSYNFSGNAEYRNDENVVIIHSPALAARYQEQFEIVYQNGK